MLLKVAVACVVFDDVQGVERLLDSCYKEVEYVFVVDGKYKDYDATFPFSTDGLDELIDSKKYHNVVLEEAPNLIEWEKRSVYLDLCREYDIDCLIIVDSDEYFYDCDWKQFRRDLLRMKGWLYNLKNYTAIMNMKVPVDQPRIWMKPQQLEYKNARHYQFGRIGHDSVLVSKETIFSLKLIHDPTLRSQERTQKHDEYIKKLEEYEKFKQLVECNREKAQREYVVWNS